MTKRDLIELGKDQVLLRLELYLDGGNVEDGEISLARLDVAGMEPDETLTDDQLAELACRIYESRRVRARFLSSSLLGEPVWDMLLALYCFSSRGEVMSISGLCYASGVPPTTALRWSRVMEQRNLISRSKDQLDARRAWIALTDEGATLMKRYLASVHKGLTG